MSEARNTPPRPVRRRPAEAAAPAAPAPAAEPAVELAPAPPPPAAAPAPAPEPREPTDFDGLQGIADLDRASVEAMMAEYAPRSRNMRVHPGQRVDVVVTRVNASSVFADLGGKADAVLDRIEAPDDIAVGRRLVAWVHSIRDGEVRLTLTPSGDAAVEMLREAASTRTAVAGHVVSASEHGVEVQLGDGVRAFCPLSQLDRGPVDPSSLVGTTGKFRVLEVRGRDVLVSRRQVIEEEAREEDLLKLKGIREGDVIEGTVTSLREFGAFVRVAEGVEGLVHLSNLAKRRINDPSEVVKEGQVVKVRVLSVDLDRRRLNLGIKQAEDAPLPTAGPKAGGFGLFADLLKNVKVK